jgi:hypothetical protein
VREQLPPFGLGGEVLQRAVDAVDTIDAAFTVSTTGACGVVVTDAA